MAGTDSAVLMIEGYCDFLTEDQMLEVSFPGTFHAVPRMPLLSQGHLLLFQGHMLLSQGQLLLLQGHILLSQGHLLLSQGYLLLPRDTTFAEQPMHIHEWWAEASLGLPPHTLSCAFALIPLVSDWLAMVSVLAVPSGFSQGWDRV